MLKLRLKKYGRKGQASYRIVVMPSTKKRDGRSIEEQQFALRATHAQITKQKTALQALAKQRQERVSTVVFFLVGLSYITAALNFLSHAPFPSLAQASNLTKLQAALSKLQHRIATLTVEKKKEEQAVAELTERMEAVTKRVQAGVANVTKIKRTLQTTEAQVTHTQLTPITPL